MAKHYQSFAKYIEDFFYDNIYANLKSYILLNRKGLNLTSHNIAAPFYTELDDFHIMGVTFHDGKNDDILFRLAIQADIIISGHSKRDYESDIVEPWFSMECSAILLDGIHNFCIHGVSEYNRLSFNSEDALSKFLVPYIYAKDLDKHAENFLKKYYPKALLEPMPLPTEEIPKNMGLEIFYAPLNNNIFGQIYFNSATVDVYKNQYDRNICTIEIQAGTILVNPDAVFMRNIGSMSNTIIHECVHWDKHGKFFELQRLLANECSAISCEVVENYKGHPHKLESELEWMEWQANAIAPRILIPEKPGRKKLNSILTEINNEYGGYIRNGYKMEMAISRFADFFKVSTTAAKIRAIELGFDQAAGVFNYVDGYYYPPFSFKKGSLKSNQTFIIDRNNVIFEWATNQAFNTAVQDGYFIHAGGMVVINNPKYVQKTEGAEASLTDYALEHVDECCLVFNRKTRISNQYDDSFYRICYLCRDADSKSFVEAKYDPNEGKNEDVTKRAREMNTIKEEAKRISDILEKTPSTFSGTLDFHINRKGYTNEQMEERTGISVRMIHNYRNKRDTKPTLQSVLALCIGLNLQPAFSYDLIAKAGHNIMIPSEEYLIYRYLIDNHHMENIHMWNDKLKDAGIPQQLPKNGNKMTAQ